MARSKWRCASYDEVSDMKGNIGGRCADEKTGFVYEGALRQPILHNGRYHHVCVYRMLRSEYLGK